MEVERLKTRAQFDRSYVRNALAYLVSVLRPQASTTLINDYGIEDPLLTACRLVGEALGVSIRPRPNPIDGEAEPQTLDGITSASRVRTRQVALRGDWWENDNGPLLAFVQKNSGQYELEVKAEEAGSYFITAQATRLRKVKGRDGQEHEIEEGVDSVRTGVWKPVLGVPF